jgi:hypothetical protein
VRERERRRRRRRRRRKARRCRAAETNGEKEETGKTEKRKNKQFLGIKKKILNVKKYYFNDIRKIKGIYCGVFLYRKKKMVWFPKFSLK